MAKKIIISDSHFDDVFVDDKGEVEDYLSKKDDAIGLSEIDRNIFYDIKEFIDNLEQETKNKIVGKVYVDIEDNILKGYFEEIMGDDSVRFEMDGENMVFEYVNYNDSRDDYDIIFTKIVPQTKILETLNNCKNKMLTVKQNINEAKETKQYTKRDIDGLAQKVTKTLLELENAVQQHSQDVDLLKALNKMYKFCLNITPFEDYVKKRKIKVQEDIKVKSTATPKAVDLAVQSAEKNNTDVVFESKKQKYLSELLTEEEKQQYDTWGQDSIGELLDAVGQDNYKFTEYTSGKSRGDYGVVYFKCNIDNTKLFLKFEDQETADTAQNRFSDALTNPYDFHSRPDIWPATVVVTFYNDNNN